MFVMTLLQLELERRQQLATFAKEASEESRVAMRNIRRDSNRPSDQLQKDKEISEDEHKDLKNEIQKLLKESKLKVQAAIQEDKVRVTGAKRDDLQAAMALIRKDVTDVPLSFDNFRD